MSIELITVRTADGIELDGALYLPPQGFEPHGVGVLMVHGLTWNFYRGPARWLPPLLTGGGYPCLSLNMRDHDLQEPKDFELSHHDLCAGINALLSRGAREVVVLAHGYACNKVVCYPEWSGDRRLRRAVLTTLGAVKSYRPEIWNQVLQMGRQMQGQVLVVQGAVDTLIEAQARADELVAVASGASVQVVLLEGANHYFDHRHEELAGAILRWLAITGQRGSERRITP